MQKAVAERLDQTDNTPVSEPRTQHLILLFFLIAVVAICTIELAGRISAKAYLNRRIADLNSQLAKGPREPAIAESSGVGGSQTETLRYRVAQYEGILDGIEQLDFSGAVDFNQTIYGLNSAISRIHSEASNQSRAQALARQRDAAEAQLRNLTSEESVSNAEVDKIMADYDKRSGALRELTGSRFPSREAVLAYLTEGVRLDPNMPIPVVPAQSLGT
jgi:hypothetical protein